MATNISIESAPTVRGANLIADGERALADGDRETACRKAWAAVESGLKTAAERRFVPAQPVFLHLGSGKRPKDGGGAQRVEVRRRRGDL